MRWTHWVNFPILAIMIWSGLLIYWANDVYTVTVFGHTFVRFFPDWFYKALHIRSRLAEGMAFHFLFMWFFALNGLFYVLYTIFSGEWRLLVPNRRFYKPVQLYWLTWLCGGYTFARILHFILTIGYVLFFIVHIVQVILAGWNNFRSVVSGFEVEEIPEPKENTTP